MQTTSALPASSSSAIYSPEPQPLPAASTNSTSAFGAVEAPAAFSWGDWLGSIFGTGCCGRRDKRHAYETSEGAPQPVPAVSRDVAPADASRQLPALTRRVAQIVPIARAPRGGEPPAPALPAQHDVAQVPPSGVPAPDTQVQAQSLGDRIEALLLSGLPHREKRVQLGSVLQEIRHDDAQVIRLVLGKVLASAQLPESQKVFFVSHVFTANRNCLSGDDVKVLARELRANHAAWRNTTHYGQVFSHIYEGCSARLTLHDLESEKQAFNAAGFPPKLLAAPDFKRWAPTKINELIARSAFQELRAARASD